MKIDLLHSLKQGKAKLWMVLIGVNHYQDDRVPLLRFAVADCEGLAAALDAATKLFPQREMLTHYGTSEQPLCQQAIEHSLARLYDPITGMKPEDILLFFFSGHGVLEPSTQQLYLCLSDTHLDQLHHTGLPMQSLLQRLKASGVGQQVIILDACHSGQIHFTATLETTLQTYGSQNQDFQALLSCSRHDQTAWELAELSHSVFTYYLIDGIRGAAVDETGQIEVDQLYRYVRDRTYTLVRERLGQHQVPSQIKVGHRDIIIGYQHPEALPTLAASTSRQSDREPLSPRKTIPMRLSKFFGKPPIRIAAGAFVLGGITFAGTKLYQQHQLQEIQQTEQAELDRIRQLKTTQRYQECISDAERFPPTAHFRSAAQGLVEQCQSAQYQAWLTQGQMLINQGKLSAAIAQLQPIPQQAALYPMAQQLINQAAQRVLKIASQHYQKGELERAISLAQVTPQSSSLYREGQQKIKQWVQNWNKDKNHFANATKAKASSKQAQVIKEGEQIKHPYWKQKVAPLVAETKVALKRLEMPRKPPIATIDPPSYLAHMPINAPSDYRPLPANQPVSANLTLPRSLPETPLPARSTFSSAEVERF